MASGSGPDPRRDGSEARAERLVRRFHADPPAFGRLAAVAAAEVPEPWRGLLDHASHMTVAMERFYGGPVEVVVVAVHADEAPAAFGRGWYEREILLQTADGRIVQHGIVRIDPESVAPEVMERIRSGREPLGRVLLSAGILLEVQGVGLLAVDIGPELGAQLAGDRETPAASGRTFGRVAEIAVDGRPAVELLEIVAPGPLPKVLR